MILENVSIKVEKGKTKIKSAQGNLIPVYDIDLTICDIIIDREKNR